MGSVDNFKFLVGDMKKKVKIHFGSLLKMRFSSNAQLEIPILICLYCASGRQIKKKSISSLNIICFQHEVNFEKKVHEHLTNHHQISGAVGAGGPRGSCPPRY